MTTFICPVKNARLTSKFGWRNLGFGKEWHQGIDLASTGNVPIYASADGIVIRAGILGSYGNVVIIRHTINGKRMDTNYAHLDSLTVRVGQIVKQGQPIGVMGKTGRSLGIHLHFEIHDGAWATGQPNAVDPMKYISLSNDVDVIKNTPIPSNSKVEEGDDIMKFTNKATENAVRTFIEQSVNKDLIDKSWLTKFDTDKMTYGDYLGLQIIVNNRK